MRADALLGSYLAVLGVDGSTERVCLRRGQFHDVVLAGEVAYRFPGRGIRGRLPARVRLLGALAAAAPGGGLYAALIPESLAGPDIS
jgi:hypothetical protein